MRRTLASLSLALFTLPLIASLLFFRVGFSSAFLLPRRQASLRYDVRLKSRCDSPRSFSGT